MSKTCQTGRGWKAFWLLALLALSIRLGLVGADPGAEDDDALGRIAALSVFCAGDWQPDAPGHHHPGWIQDDACLDAAAHQGDGNLLSFASPTGAVLSLPEARTAWRFPPVRGPPFHLRAARFAQGPPFSLS